MRKRPRGGSRFVDWVSVFRDIVITVSLAWLLWMATNISLFLGRISENLRAMRARDAESPDYPTHYSSMRLNVSRNDIASGVADGLTRYDERRHAQRHARGLVRLVGSDDDAPAS